MTQVRKIQIWYTVQVNKYGYDQIASLVLKGFKFYDSDDTLIEKVGNFYMEEANCSTVTLQQTETILGVATKTKTFLPLNSVPGFTIYPSFDWESDF